LRCYLQLLCLQSPWFLELFIDASHECHCEMPSKTRQFLHLSQYQNRWHYLNRVSGAYEFEMAVSLRLQVHERKYLREALDHSMSSSMSVSGYQLSLDSIG